MMKFNSSTPRAVVRLLVAFCAMAWTLVLPPPVLAQDALSELKRSYPATTKADERDVQLQVEGKIVVGTLTIPVGVKSPGVILVLGGFDPTRDGLPVNGTRESAFSRAARLWAERGYASLRISRRGTGGSEGNSQDMTLESRIAETIASINWLAQQPELDGKKIAITGYNQGAIMAVAAAGRLNASGLIRSIALWTPITNPLFYYADRAGVEKLEQGLAARPGDVVGLASRSGTMHPLKRDFYRDVWTINPAAELVSYKGAMLILMGSRDRHTPRQVGESLMRYHSGQHQLVSLDTDQGLGSFEGPDIVDYFALRTLAWFLRTLGH